MEVSNRHRLDLANMLHFGSKGIGLVFEVLLSRPGGDTFPRVGAVQTFSAILGADHDVKGD